MKIFEDVLQYTDYVVACVKRYEGDCGGQRLLDVAGFCARDYPGVERAWRVGAGRIASGLYVGFGNGGPPRVGSEVGDVVTSIDGVVGSGGIESEPVVDRGCSSGGTGAGRCSDAGMVNSHSSSVDEGLRFGKHHFRNKAKREKRKRMARSWREPVPSLAGTVCTVDTRTAEELEAANTLARRRVAENKLAEIRANRLIASYADADKTATIEKLQVARLEERINTAKAKSQASYKKCDESLKSLGSTGSAGEFALKKQIKDTKKLEARLQYVHDQFAAVYPLLSQEAIDRANAVPEPKFPTDFEVFGDCPADYTEEEREAYYLDMNIEAGEIF